jgi:hypothetical protein
VRWRTAHARRRRRDPHMRAVRRELVALFARVAFEVLDGIMERGIARIVGEVAAYQKAFPRVHSDDS